MRGDRLSPILLILCLLAGAWGGAHVLRARYAAGDLFPAYSSLRADPLGAKALHDALAEIPAVEVRRHSGAPGDLPPGGGTTILILGVRTGLLGTIDSDLGAMFGGIGRGLPAALQARARAGARVVLAFVPETWRSPPPDKDEDAAEPQEKDGKRAGKGDGEATPEEHRRSMAARVETRFGFEMDHLDLPRDPEEDEARPAAALRATGAPRALPERLDWHSAALFKDLDPAWRTIYARDGRPVLIERPFGGGSIVLMSDSFAVSNEALRRDPQPALLSWIVGPGRKVVFDETHLGVRERAGVATLLRRFRLAGVAAVVLLLAVLYLWRVASPFVPPRAGPGEEQGVVRGHTSQAGLINLLTRALPHAALLGACAAEWKKTFGRRHPDLAQAIDRASAAPYEPAAAYRRIHQLLQERGGVHES
jgi:predicted small integral membrane protein